MRQANFNKMTIDEAIDYCYEHEYEYKAMCEPGTAQEEFDDLITILELGTISPSELPRFLMIKGDM